MPWAGVFVLAGLGMAGLGSMASAQEPPSSQRSSEFLSPESTGDSESATAGPQSVLVSESPTGLQNLAAMLVRENLPTKHEDLRHWGGRKEFVSGLSIRREGLEIKTHRRRRELNHGTWRMYRIEPLDANEDFDFAIERMRQTDDGRLAFDVTLGSRLRWFARFQEWQVGVRLASVSLEGEARAEMKLGCLVRATLDLQHIPPDVVIQPHVAEAELQVRDFRLQRISHLDGPVVRELSGTVEDILQRELDRKRPQLVERINRSIAKREDKLRLSAHDLLRSPWGKNAAAYLGLPASTASTDAKSGD